MHRLEIGTMQDLKHGTVPSLMYLGAKVFMDAHEPVTLEEGDRYPLAPPNINISTMRRNIFVLFAPGTGGNHFRNLLSNSSIFSVRAGPEEYLKHEFNNAHVTTLRNLDLEQIKNTPGAENQVLCGHWGELYWLMINDQLEKFSNKQIVIVKFPKKHSMAYNRFIKHTGINDEYLIEEQRSLYSTQIVESVFKVSDLFEIDTDLYFKESLDDLFKFTSNDMNLVLDQTQCNSMHQIWFSKIKQSLNTAV